MPVGGQNFFDILAANPILTWAMRGFAMNDATQSGVDGIRKMIEVDLPAISRSDAFMEPYKDGQEIKIKYQAWQDNYAAVKRAILRCLGLQQATVQYDIDYYNFRDYNGNGEGLLGMELSLDVSESDIELTLNLHGKVRPTIWASILAAHAASSVGSSLGTSISGLTAGAFDDAEYGIPGIEAIYVGTGNLTTDDNLGLLEAGTTKFNLSLMKIGDTTLMQPISKRFEFKNTIGMYQNKMSPDLTALHAFTNTEKVITWVLKNGITFVFNNCTKLVEAPKLNDTNNIVTLRHEGAVFADAVNGAQVRVVFDDANKKITFNKN